MLEEKLEEILRQRQTTATQTTTHTVNVSITDNSRQNFGDSYTIYIGGNKNRSEAKKGAVKSGKN